MNMSLSADVENCILDEGEYFTEINGIQVPQNICHRFRSKITSELLVDRKKVERDQPIYDRLTSRQSTPIYRRSQSMIAVSNDDYSKISNDLRSSICYGHPVQRASHSKAIHNRHVFDKEKVESSSTHRRRKDWLGRWTEANIIRDRLYKNIADSQKKSNH